MKSFLITVLSTFLLFGAVYKASADIIILETTDTKQPEHSETVSSVACKEDLQTCDVSITDFNTNFLNEFIDSLSSGDVVNMSFGYQRADESISLQNHFHSMQAQGLFTSDYSEVYDEREELFLELLEENPDVLFVVAAGNGSPLSSSLGANGIPVGPLFRIYPTIFENENLIKVTSANVESFNLNDRIEYEIPDYANYSTDYIDVAAPVEVHQEGTSFAAPYVTRLAGEINAELQGRVTASDLKKIFQKSCYIQDLDKSLELITDYKLKPRTSIIGKIQNLFFAYEERKALVESIRPVMLVKCGGVISSEVAKACAKSYVSAGGGLSLTEACSRAQSREFKLTESETLKLKEFWTLQGI